MIPKAFLLSKSARKPVDTSPLPLQFWQGVAQFNQGEFYACHDTLEALWFESGEPERSFYQGILQIAVACYHLGNGNWRGAVILLGEGTHRLGSYPANFGDIDLEGFCQQSDTLLHQLQLAGAEQFPQGPLPRINQVQS